MHRFTLRLLLTLFAFGLTITAITALSVLTEKTATKILENQLGDQLIRRVTILGDKIDRALYERYRDIQLQTAYLMEQDTHLDIAIIRQRFDKLSMEYDGYAWIGYANAQGKVQIANKALLEGADVSTRPWFIYGNNAAFFGDVHRALLLEKKLNAPGAEPLRFLDIAMPVTRKDGTFAGVLGAHIDWRWIREISYSLPKIGHTDVLLVSSDNTVLLGPKTLQDQQLVLASIQEAKNGRSGYRIERWPDGKIYLTGYAQSQGYKQYTGLGWVVLERHELNQAFAPIYEERQQFIFWGLVIAGLFATLGWFLAAWIAYPLTHITQAANLLKRGQPKARIPVIRGYREVAVLSRTLSSLIKELTDRERQLEHQATHHSLTSLPNRSFMKALIDQAIENPQNKTTQITISIVDLDKFKKINDTLGYEAGNTALLALKERLKITCIGMKGTLGHLSKDEFILMLEDHDDTLPQTSLIAINIMKAVAEPFSIDGTDFSLSASIGISHFPKDGQNAEALLDSALLAVHQAKKNGGNCIEFYESQMNAFVVEQWHLERDLRQALERNEFELHYQPQLSLKNNQIIGVEALLRWRHPEKGLISPARFIPVAEASGLIIPIGKWVLNAACMQAAHWREKQISPVRMGVNVSVKQFSEEQFVHDVSLALASSGLQPEFLKLEITESLLMNDIEQSIAMMGKIAEMGVYLSIDDFGTGYSSLSYLKRFPIHELKIDRAFIHELKPESKDAAIVRTILSLAQNLNLSVVAEGVETQEQCAFLEQMGCNAIQGYYFSRPAAADKIGALLHAPD